MLPDTDTDTGSTAAAAHADRRFFLRTAAVTGFTLLGSGLGSLSAFAQDPPTIGTDPGALLLNPRNAREHAMAVLSRAELSLATSQIAVARATQANAKEFAGFELAEAIAVTSTLREIGTPVPTMTSKARATLAQIQNAPAGPAFDQAFIAAQLQNHIELRDLTQAYLSHTAPMRAPTAEAQGRHLAMLSLAVFKEHVMITQRISAELAA